MLVYRLIYNTRNTKIKFPKSIRQPMYFYDFYFLLTKTSRIDTVC